MNSSQHDLAAKIGRGVRLFRIRHPKRHFDQIADLGGLPGLMIGGRKVWKLRETDIYFALLTIPYTDEEDLLIRAEGSVLEGQSLRVDLCRWRRITVYV